MGNEYSSDDDEYVANEAWKADKDTDEDTVTMETKYVEANIGEKGGPIKQVWVVAAKLDPAQMAVFNDKRKIFNSPSATGVIRSHNSLDVFLPLFA